MELYDWLLALHVIAAFGLVAGVVASWTLVLATGKREVLGPAEAGRFGMIAGPTTAAMAGLTLIFGLWIAIHVDAYDILDFWIIASIVLWTVAQVTGPMSGKAFQEGPAGRGKGISLLALNTALVTLILIFMIWKPGA